MGKELSNEFGNKYENQIQAGLLQIVAVKIEYYPDYLKNGIGSKESLKLLWGDDMKRTLWRTKQALDYIYLWKIAEPLCEYFLQLEDDVLAKRDFMRYIDSKVNTWQSDPNGKDWHPMEFSPLGFIGKLFKAEYMWK